MNDAGLQLNQVFYINLSIKYRNFRNRNSELKVKMLPQDVKTNICLSQIASHHKEETIQSKSNAIVEQQGYLIHTI